MVSGKQIKAARALLGIGQRELAKLSEVSVPTVTKMELGGKVWIGDYIIKAIENEGIEFIDGGVKLVDKRNGVAETKSVPTTPY